MFVSDTQLQKCLGPVLDQYIQFPSKDKFVLMIVKSISSYNYITVNSDMTKVHLRIYSYVSRALSIDWIHRHHRILSFQTDTAMHLAHFCDFDCGKRQYFTRELFLCTDHKKVVKVCVTVLNFLKIYTVTIHLNCNLLGSREGGGAAPSDLKIFCEQVLLHPFFQ